MRRVTLYVSRSLSTFSRECDVFYGPFALASEVGPRKVRRVVPSPGDGAIVCADSSMRCYRSEGYSLTHDETSPHPSWCSPSKVENATSHPDPLVRGRHLLVVPTYARMRAARRRPGNSIQLARGPTSDAGGGQSQRRGADTMDRGEAYCPVRRRRQCPRRWLTQPRRLSRKELAPLVFLDSVTTYANGDV